MNLTLRIDPRDAAPIWRQIEEGVRRLVASCALRPGAAAPSVRELARELRVNPATVSKAYQRLCEAGVLAVRRGEGTFVTDSPPRMDAAERRGLLRSGALRYASLARTSGAARDEAIGEVGDAWTELEAQTSGGGR